MADSFDFTDTIAALKQEASKEVQELSKDILIGAVNQSRVDTGRMRGNWVVGIDQATDQEREPILSGQRKSADRANANGQRAIVEGSKEIETFDIDKHDIVVVQNNTEYVEIWNERDSISSLAISGALKK